MMREDSDHAAAGGQAPLPGSLQRVFGPKLCHRIEEAVVGVLALEPAIPASSSFVYLRPYATTVADIKRRQVADPDDPTLWHQIQLPIEDDQIVWMATNLIKSTSAVSDWLTVALLDLHPRMSAWLLTARWRAEELALETVDGLRAWRVVSAATTARALTEGVFAFLGEAKALESAWTKMKLSGPPEQWEVLGFRDILDDPLSQAQLASRYNPRNLEVQDHLNRRNVITLLDKGKKASGVDPSTVQDLYDQLCDAVHPSYGSQSAYVTRNRIHPSEAQIWWEIRRGPTAVPDPGDDLVAQPAVAIAAARALCVSLEEFALAWPHFLKTVDDFGLTTEVCFRTTLDYWRRHDRPSPNSPCPCGSGRKWKRCPHEWGAAAATFDSS